MGRTHQNCRTVQVSVGLGVENHNVDITETITHLSLCSGYDGIGLGLRRVWPQVREVAHVEIEAFAAANLVAKMEAGELDSAPVWTNLKTFPAWRFRGCVDILSAGFPCQPFSCAGARAADDDPRHLWPHVRQAVGLIRPRMVIFENVEGIISSKLKGNDWNDPEGTPVLLHILRELERTGYKCTWGIFSAAEVGAPHQRKRVFIVGLEDTNSSRGEKSMQLDTNLPAKSSRCYRKEREELGNTEHNGLPTTEGRRGISEEQKEGWLQESERGRKQSKELGNTKCEGWLRSTLWPTCPGEEQYEWEEPRTIEPRLGGATNGTTSRVDRLRLLGNGVVPQTAERAVTLLLKKLYTPAS